MGYQDAIARIGVPTEELWQTSSSGVSDGVSSFDTKGTQDITVQNQNGISFNDQDAIAKNREYNLGEVPGQIGKEHNGSGWDIVKTFSSLFPNNYSLNRNVFPEEVGNRLHTIA